MINSYFQWIVSLLQSVEGHNFLDCNWFKKRLFFTNSLAKLLSDSLVSLLLLINKAIRHLANSNLLHFDRCQSFNGKFLFFI